jgi:hypothetical protein
MIVERVTLDEASITPLIDFMLPMVFSGAAWTGCDQEAAIYEGYRTVGEGFTHVVKSRNRIVGSVAMIKSPYWYNPSDWALSDRWLFIHEAMPWAAVCVRLLRAVKADARRVNKLAYVARTNHQRTPETMKVGEHITAIGFVPVGTIYPVFVPKPVNE